MYARVLGETPNGLDGEIIIVEVDLERGLPGFEIVGLPDMAIRESRERVRTALKNSGFPPVCIFRPVSGRGLPTPWAKYRLHFELLPQEKVRQ